MGVHGGTDRRLSAEESAVGRLLEHFPGRGTSPAATDYAVCCSSRIFVRRRLPGDTTPGTFWRRSARRWRRFGPVKSTRFARRPNGWRGFGSQTQNRPQLRLDIFRPSRPGCRATWNSSRRWLRPTGLEGAKWIRENLPKATSCIFSSVINRTKMSWQRRPTRLGVRTIFITSRRPGAEVAASQRHLYVDPHWPVTDACLDLPGYDVKACPLSGIMGVTCYYAICGEAVRR